MKILEKFAREKKSLPVKVLQKTTLKQILTCSKFQDGKVTAQNNFFHGKKIALYTDNI